MGAATSSKGLIAILSRVLVKCWITAGNYDLLSRTTWVPNMKHSPPVEDSMATRNRARTVTRRRAFRRRLRTLAASIVGLVKMALDSCINQPSHPRENHRSSDTESQREGMSDHTRTIRSGAAFSRPEARPMFLSAQAFRIESEQVWPTTS